MNKYSEIEYEIFSRLFILKEFSADNIKKLSAIKVGIIGIGGIGFMLYGLYLLLLPEIPVGEEVLQNAMDGFLIGIIGAIIGLVLLAKLMIKSRFWQQLTAPDTQKKEKGYSNTQGWESFKGTIGITDTDLHPSGWIKIEDQRVFVISEGDFISKGKNVKVLSVDGNRVIVREILN